MDRNTLMPAAERRRLEQEKLKSARMHHIIECTFGLFAEKGIETISMNEIASQAEIGVASLYRYFSTKEELAIEVAIYAWHNEEDIFHKVFSSENYDKLTGFQQMKTLLELFPEALVSQSSFFRFIYYFDSFVKKENVSQERLGSYENTIVELKSIVINALKKGREDGSITFNSVPEMKDKTDDEIYFTMMHSLFSLAQKLAFSGEMLYMDLDVGARIQIELLTKMLISSLH